MQEPDHVFYGFYTVTLVTATVVCVLCVCVCVCVRARACVYRLMDIYCEGLGFGGLLVVVLMWLLTH